MTGTVLAAISLALALPPAILFLRNLRLYRRPGPPVEGASSASGRAEDTVSSPSPRVSILIPARNEEAGIALAVEAALTDQGLPFEVVVLDDHSEDDTAAIVRRIALTEPRVRLAEAPDLPDGWCGKQHACMALAREARGEVLLFVDADVRLEPGAAARVASFLESSGASLASGVPRQETETLLEKLLVPLIHFLLLGFLPIARMRRSRSPAYAAGCGQIFAARRADYEAVGGHGHPIVRASLHDGIKLPRAFRLARFATDLFDATDVARCRMYRGAGEVWRGLAKNATEGLGAPALIGPASILLVGGHVLPFLLLALAPWLEAPAIALAAAAAAAALLPRLVACARFHQSVLGAILHPLGIALLVAIQWYALVRSIAGRPATWRGRSYGPTSRPTPSGDRPVDGPSRRAERSAQGPEERPEQGPEERPERRSEENPRP